MHSFVLSAAALLSLAACTASTTAQGPETAKPVPVQTDAEAKRLALSKVVVDLGLMNPKQATYRAHGQIWEGSTVISLERWLAARPQEASGSKGKMLAHARKTMSEWIVDYGSVALAMHGGDRLAYKAALHQVDDEMDLPTDIYGVDFLDDVAFTKIEARYFVALDVAEPCAKHLAVASDGLKGTN
jgi:hypothetical protein